MDLTIITGTSSGLGKAFFNYFQNKNSGILAISRRFLLYQQKLAHSKKNIDLMLCNLENILETEKTVKLLKKKIVNPRYDSLTFINNASIIDPLGSIGQLKNSMILKAITTNFISPTIIINCLFSSKEILKKRVRILNITTGAASHPVSGLSIYSSTKAGMLIFINTLRNEYLKYKNIQIINHDPGTLNTKMQNKIRKSRQVFSSKEYFIDLKRNKKLISPQNTVLEIVKKYNI